MQGKKEWRSQQIGTGQAPQKVWYTWAGLRHVRKTEGGGPPPHRQTRGAMTKEKHKPRNSGTTPLSRRVVKRKGPCKKNNCLKKKLAKLVAMAKRKLGLNKTPKAVNTVQKKSHEGRAKNKNENRRWSHQSGDPVGREHTQPYCKHKALDNRWGGV